MSGGCWKSPVGANRWRRDAGEQEMRGDDDRETGEILGVRVVHDRIEAYRRKSAGIPASAAADRVKTPSA